MARFIHSNMTGAPALATTAGGALAMLNAVLVSGFNIGNPTSVSVASGVATFEYAAAHGYEDKCWVRIAGAGAAALNADLQCTVPGTTTLTVPAPGVPDGPVSGSIETRVAPLGWESPFVATNVAVYRSPNVVGTRLFFQVDDTNVGGQQAAVLTGYESMSNATTGVDRFPLTTQTAIASRLVKGSATPWAIAGDDRTAYIYTGSVSQGANYQGVAYLGDFASDKPADAFAAGVNGNTSNAAAGFMADCTSGGVGTMYVARASNGLQKSLLTSKAGVHPGQSGRNKSYPNPVSGGLTFVRPLLVLDGASSASAVRGAMRGAMFVNELVGLSAQWLVADPVAGVTGRVVVFPDGGGAVAFAVDETW